MKSSRVALQFLFSVLMLGAVSCKKDTKKGCMDSQYTNYDPEANEDDGSCCRNLSQSDIQRDILVEDYDLDSLADGSPVVPPTTLGFLKLRYMEQTTDGPCQPHGSFSDCVSFVDFYPQVAPSLCDSVSFKFEFRAWGPNLTEVLVLDSLVLVGGDFNKLQLGPEELFCNGYSPDSVSFVRTSPFHYYY